MRNTLTAKAAAFVVAFVALMSLGLSASADGFGVVDTDTGEWYLRDPDDGKTTSFFYGNPGDVPFVGDWDGDGDETPGLYRQSDGYAYLRNSNSQGNANIRFFFGNPGDIPLAGDFDGDGFDTVSIYRPAESRIYIINRLGQGDVGLGKADQTYYFGNPGDKPFVGDFDNDGVDEVGLHRESTGLVYFRLTHTQGVADVQFIYGDPGDKIMAARWNGSGPESVGIYRSWARSVYLRYTNTQGVADFSAEYGVLSGLPVAGQFGALTPNSDGPRVATGRGQVLAGISTHEDDLFDDIHSWSGKRMTFCGIFGWDIETHLEWCWQRKATPVLMWIPNDQLSMAQIANGALDRRVREAGAAIKKWTDRGGGRSMIFAPLSEMNSPPISQGGWLTYGADPTNAKRAWIRFWNIFRDEYGLRETKVRWALPLNNYGSHSLSAYYPGDQYVDIVGISAFNFGSGWSATTVVNEALLELGMAPNKPWMLLQTGTTSGDVNKDAWLRELFAASAQHPNMVGIVLFDAGHEKWLYSYPWIGMRDGMASSSTKYQWPLTNWFQPGPLLFR